MFFFLLRDSCTIHSTLSHLQFPHGAPSTTSHRTLRARHDTQALAARLLVTLAGPEASGLEEARFFGFGGDEALCRGVFPGVMVAPGTDVASGLLVAGASTGAGLIAIGVGLLWDAMVVFLFRGSKIQVALPFSVSCKKGSR